MCDHVVLFALAAVYENSLNNFDIYLYNDVPNILWEHLYKFETNLMNIKGPKTFFKIITCVFKI